MNKKYPKIEHMNSRDYTFVGITAVFDEFVSQNAENFYGKTFSEMISVYKDGQFYHGEVQGERRSVPKSFLQKVNSGQVDFDKLTADFDLSLSNYNRLIYQEPKELNLHSIVELYHFYRALLHPAYSAFESLDVIEVLDEDKRDGFRVWAEKTRAKAEKIYKDGENIFIPKYLKFLRERLQDEYSDELLKFTFFEEIINYLDENAPLPEVSELEKRKDCMYVSQYPYNKYELLSGDDARAVIQERNLFPKIDRAINSVNGTVAYKGKCTGPARIILGQKDFEKFENGDVIIASMTDPNYMPIMKEASAFVTDEGGVLCHAAIISREMKKPCIIGTKNATQVFKDGDLVEVDAENGVVRRLDG